MDEEERVCQMQITHPQGFDPFAVFLDFYLHFILLLFLRRRVGRAVCCQGRLCGDPGRVLTACRKEEAFSKYKTHHEFWPHHSPSGLGPKHTGISRDRFQWALALSQFKPFKHGGPCPSPGQPLTVEEWMVNCNWSSKTFPGSENPVLCTVQSLKLP